MKKFVFVYPGDPPIEGVEMSLEEFKKMYPVREIGFLWMDEKGFTQESFTFTEVICDSCNANLENKEEKVYIVGDYLYCEKCAKKWVLPYIKRWILPYIERYIERYIKPNDGGQK